MFRCFLTIVIVVFIIVGRIISVLLTFIISYCGDPHGFVPFDFISDSTALSSVFGRICTFLTLDAKNNKNHYGLKYCLKSQQM